MQYGKELAEDHLGLVTRPLTHFFYLYCVVLATFLCWVLSLVDVGIKKIRKRILHSHMRVTWILFYFLKAINFQLPLDCLLKSHSKKLDFLQIFCILVCLIETLLLYNLVPKISWVWMCCFLDFC